MGACWGYDKFIAIEKLENEGFLLPEKDLVSTHIRTSMHSGLKANKEYPNLKLMIFSKNS